MLQKSRWQNEIPQLEVSIVAATHGPPRALSMSINTKCVLCGGGVNSNCTVLLQMVRQKNDSRRQRKDESVRVTLMKNDVESYQTHSRRREQSESLRGPRSRLIRSFHSATLHKKLVQRAHTVRSHHQKHTGDVIEISDDDEPNRGVVERTDTCSILNTLLESKFGGSWL